MMYLLWSLPALTVIAAIASGRVNTTIAAAMGLLGALPIALFAAPAPFAPSQLAIALERGLWIGWIITPLHPGRPAVPADGGAGARIR